MAKKKLIFLGQMGAPGRYDPELFRHEPGGDDEVLWFRLLLDGLGLLSEIDYEGRRICYGAPMPEPDEAEAFVIGGSFHSVHDDLPFQHAILDWLAGLRAMDDPPPVFGICGGHQLMARQAGAPVARVASGIQAATQPIQVTAEGRDHWLFRNQPEQPAYHFGNEEHVTALPEGARVLARHPAVPHAALDYGRGWVSVQFHPEAAHDSFARGWRDSHPEFMRNYRPTPHAPALFENFLAANGVIQR